MALLDPTPISGNTGLHVAPERAGDPAHVLGLHGVPHLVDVGLQDVEGGGGVRAGHAGHVGHVGHVGHAGHMAPDPVVQHCQVRGRRQRPSEVMMPRNMRLWGLGARFGC